MKYLWCWIALVALTGCSQGTWVKPGATEESLTNDRDACLQESAPVRPSGGSIPDYTLQATPSGALIRGNPYGTSQAQALSGSRVSMQIFNDCMEARGYTLKNRTRGAGE